jgi:hypothetical protein
MIFGSFGPSMAQIHAAQRDAELARLQAIAHQQEQMSAHNCQGAVDLVFVDGCWQVPKQIGAA